jgi:hypothetical protein
VVLEDAFSRVEKVDMTIGEDWELKKIRKRSETSWDFGSEIKIETAEIRLERLKKFERLI